ncbi:hypothetical protein NGB30_05395 [Mammaliicoccus fleurettii]|uniref:hypothetical protein n=1 Tax=Mammaliicoccus fleurettii TaxID=150056 RepID=UPI002DBFF825|nr:hypothetical protein [Mammaliicoccus fleurettii]MEB7779969.1 hypothetical protein [Mammaliicoccus fleurettii]
MINLKDIQEFVKNNNYDIKLTNNGRWIDQKCTPDVVCIVADCIIHYLEDNEYDSEFTSGNIWKNNYTKEYVEEIFSKPGTNHKKSRNEYDKFFSQPLELLASSKILRKTKKGIRNFYTVNNLELLEFVSLKERNTIEFLYIYIKKVLEDSDIWQDFAQFFEIQTQEAYYELKTNFEDFIIEHTKINKETEVRRIFTKVINIIAYKNKKFGTNRGRISKHIITYSNLMYNQVNFRDMYHEKPKNMTRKEWESKKGIEINVNYYKYQSAKAKKLLRKYNDEKRFGYSEVDDEYKQGKATQVHHIFPQHKYPEIAGYLENLICLTPTQHFYKAHPNNNTQIIDNEYQELMLKSKSGIIQEDIEEYGDNSIYNFKQVIEVLNIGFEKDYEVADNDFVKVMNIINSYYQ